MDSIGARGGERTIRRSYVSSAPSSNVYNVVNVTTVYNNFLILQYNAQYKQLITCNCDPWSLPKRSRLGFLRRDWPWPSSSPSPGWPFMVALRKILPLMVLLWRLILKVFLLLASWRCQSAALDCVTLWPWQTCSRCAFASSGSMGARSMNSRGLSLVGAW